MSKDETILAFYIEQAIKTASDLSKKVRELNNTPINPNKGVCLKLMPVYESNQSSLLSVTNDICPTEITVVTKQPEYVDAYWKFYRNKTVIIVTEQNYCWSRYFVCKELMNNYLHETGQEITTIPNLHRLILEITSGLSVTPEPSKQYLVDEAAYYGALEYLLPTDMMPLIKKIVSELTENENKEAAIEQMAIWMRVPKGILEFKLANSD